MTVHRNVRTFVYSRYRPGARTIARHEVGGLVLIEFTLLTFKPKLIVELGTGHFGMTAIFHETDLDIEIHSFDFANYVDRADLAGRGLTNEELAIFKNKVFEDGKTKFYVEDILKENQKIVDLLKRPEKKLLYCDNGGKAIELALYTKYLNKWDILGVHDWGFEGISYEVPQVKEALEGFEYQHHVNDLFEARQCSSRFFVKEPYIG
jgi:hypothetical protein